jgi:glycerol-3-phosphate acyltransferase PlsX
MLEQFGILGTVYMRSLFGIDKPEVALANNGAEDSKGTELQIEAYRLMQENKNMHFIGNIEGRDIPLGRADVVIADGFTGNMILKVYEGLGLSMLSQLKGMLMKNAGTKVAALILKPALREFRDNNDSAKVGGAPIIGLQKPVIKAHGSSKAEAVKNAIRQAIKWSGSGVTEAIAAALQKE